MTPVLIKSNRVRVDLEYNFRERVPRLSTTTEMRGNEGKKAKSPEPLLTASSRKAFISHASRTISCKSSPPSSRRGYIVRRSSEAALAGTGTELDNGHLYLQRVRVVLVACVVEMDWQSLKLLRDILELAINVDQSKVSQSARGRGLVLDSRMYSTLNMHWRSCRTLWRMVESR